MQFLYFLSVSAYYLSCFRYIILFIRSFCLFCIVFHTMEFYEYFTSLPYWPSHKVLPINSRTYQLQRWVLSIQFRALYNNTFYFSICVKAFTKLLPSLSYWHWIYFELIKYHNISFQLYWWNFFLWSFSRIFFGNLNALLWIYE